MRLQSSLAVLAAIGIGVAGFEGCSAEIEASSSGSLGGGGAVVVAPASSGIGGDTSSVSSSIGSGGNGGSGGEGIGSGCDSDAVCASGLTCVTDGAMDPVFGGGPAGGFCTKACDTDVDCVSADGQDGVCLKIDAGQSGRCTIPCTLGPPVTTVGDLVNGTMDTTKCLGRQDLRCAKSKGTDGVCLPTCGSDVQCPGRVCDPRLAVCVDKPEEGLGTGSACDPTANPTTCAGACVGFNSGVAMCSTHCVLGGLQTFDCGGPTNGFCVFHPAANGIGDGGFCSPACTGHTDCQTPNFWCFNVPGLSQQSQKGYCFAATPCPSGQSDCIAANSSSYLCTSTPAGPFCLDPAFTPIPSGADAGP